MTSTAAVWPLTLYAAVVLALVALIIGLSSVLGERRRDQAMEEPFESGIVGLGSAHLRFPAKFYLLAMFFVIFDAEAVFLFAWAIAWREVGWSGYAGAVIFVVALLAALAYLWRLGALDWGPERYRPVR